ncbi:FecR domain-containing protein [Mangrovibacterium marinum]|uniref:FecR family protein n=1 Tax=Mangrovibacterium marinum TaxID=1639118 RepID=UPI002A1896DC|nr:FecR domain-containing protein [Mangrovibacterium marinum]
MDKTKNIGQLIEKYLNDQCSAKELETVAEIFQSEQYREKLQPLLYDYWSNTPSFRHEVAEDELGQMLDTIHHRINLEEPSERPLVKRLYLYTYKAAAILFIPLLIFSVWQLAANFNPNENNYLTLETPMGSKMKTTLPDGTEVWQNAGTTLKYPADFSKQNREVFLVGEAYFHVESDKNNPFHVQTPEGTITVTGTRFNVSNYATDNTYSVVLEEGKVSFRPSGASDKIDLKPLQQIILDKADGVLHRRTIDIEKFTSWKDGRLIFRNDPLEEIVRRLGRWYDADIRIVDPEGELNDYTFTMTVQQEPLDQVLEYLTQASGLHLKKEQISANGSVIKMKYEILK